MIVPLQVQLQSNIWANQNRISIFLFQPKKLLNVWLWSLKMDSNTPMGLFYAHKECSVYLKEGETRVQGAMVWF